MLFEVTWNLPDLNESLRAIMLDELETDVIAGVVLESRVIDPGLFDKYLDMQRVAFATGNPDSLAADILASGILLDRQANGNRVNHEAAAKRLAGGQFGAYYSRAVGIVAEDGADEVEIYRARHSTNPRVESELKIGTRLDAARLVADLRANSSTAEFLVLPEVNSGLLVRLIR
jgi:hypothetical protein